MAKEPIPVRRAQRLRAAPAILLEADPQPPPHAPPPPPHPPKTLVAATPLPPPSAPAPSAAPPKPLAAAAPPAAPPKPPAAPAPSSPPKPANVFPAIVDPKPEALVISCSDPRFHAAFRQFVEGALGLLPGEYVSFTVAGGAGVLARPDTLPKEFKFMRDRIALLRSRFSSLKRLIVINHEDCAYYQELGEKAAWLFQPFHAHLSRDDMKLVAQVYARRLSHLGLALEMYYARFVEGDPSMVAIDRVEGGVVS